ncbi:hypothetical protein [Nocardioides nitrophenolicus]|uniref:hypothetical protein n=1 Tax=Nocardioides nitrophenolicus TaxID=60489 RepID=UPI00195AFA0B|nr:hypothetical protein [Nocardioides nitrophenolicus]MBM7516578.1 hypothetical protein [Nocardioides nitrophenolicus]
MPSDFAYSSLRRLASAPGARHLIQRVRGEQDEIRLAIGRLESHLLDLRRPQRLQDAEFKVFSQFGEDGIIQHLVRSVDPAETTFVEIGTGDYRESNTRFLLQNDNWRGVVIDGGEDHVRFVLGSGLSWRYDVEPVSAFVTRENVNQLITDAGLSGRIGLLSVDVDGIDYWLWNAIDVVDPAIVVAEYNALLGPEATITVPYDPAFVNSEAHYSQLYFGASLGALVHLGAQRGYRFVGCASNGANAFFVREDVAGDLPAQTAASGYRESRFLTGRNPDGTLSRTRSVAERLTLIGDLPVVDVTTGTETTVAAAVGDRGRA